jgi:hypothetical protein
MNLGLKFDSVWLGSVDVNAVPVQVIGAGGEGVWTFPNLAAAQQKFPELDLNRCTSNFTCAMRGEMNDAPALRFETWAAYQLYSN